MPSIIRAQQFDGDRLRRRRSSAAIVRVPRIGMSQRTGPGLVRYKFSAPLTVLTFPSRHARASESSCGAPGARGRGTCRTLHLRGAFAWNGRDASASHPDPRTFTGQPAILSTAPYSSRVHQRTFLRRPRVRVALHMTAERPDADRSRGGSRRSFRAARWSAGSRLSEAPYHVMAIFLPGPIDGMEMQQHRTHRACPPAGTEK